MKQHRGMRPQDIVILLKIAAKGHSEWFMKDISIELGISASEVSESLNRSALAGLIAQDKKRIMNLAVLDFLEHGLKYVYPEKPGAVKRGVRTVHSAPPLDHLIQSNEVYVWPYEKGEDRGQAIEPLYHVVPKAAMDDRDFYELMSLCDTMRVGKVREKEIAIQELKSRLC